MGDAPRLADELGGEAALQNFVREWSKQFGVEAEFHAAGFAAERLQPGVETNLYRIFQKALQNVRQHTFKAEPPAPRAEQESRP